MTTPDMRTLLNEAKSFINGKPNFNRLIPLTLWKKIKKDINKKQKDSAITWSEDLKSVSINVRPGLTSNDIVKILKIHDLDKELDLKSSKTIQQAKNYIEYKFKKIYSHG
jgi:hypothetical protein